MFVGTDIYMTFIEVVAIMVLTMMLVITYIPEVNPEVSAIIALIMMRLSEIKMIHISINLINTEQPTVMRRINGTEEIIHIHKSTVLRCRKDPTQIVIAIIQELIITVDCSRVSAHHIVHDVTDIVDEVVVHFIHIVILHGTQTELVCHTVGKETCIFTHLALAHGSHHRKTHTEHHNHHPKGSQLLHIFSVLKVIVFL